VLDVLDGMAPAAAIRSNAELGIDYLPIWSSQVDPLVLMADGRTRDLLEAMRSRYDCIVIDGAPSIGNAEARVLAALADHVILTLKWGATELDKAQAAMRDISSARPAGGPAAVSAVLTQVDLRRYAAYGPGPSADRDGDGPARWRPAVADRSGAAT
jgi:cellulose biosynthesis protein BcsQ